MPYDASHLGFANAPSAGVGITPSPHYHLKYQICISGAAETGLCAPNALEQAKTIGREIALRSGTLLNGATTGFPYWSAIGAKEAGGYTVGISPAHSEREHVEHYKLPLDYMDVIIYSGMGFPGRDLMLTRASDAVILGCGRIGTLHEFTVSFEDRKPIGILLGSGGTTEMIKDILEVSQRKDDNPNIVFETDPKALVEKIFELIKTIKIVKL